ncbi:hypothetical protein [Leifsonia aquatica]|uniref:hypothetical protein n=1 Tax=Leifsonia aquatica TaxID=144185 RepID=UPI00046A0D66|nr:hypothetical protein [Leifsonia aquatica]
MTTIPTFPEHAMTAGERRALRTQADLERQANLVTRISAATLGITTEPTRKRKPAGEYRKRIRRRRVHAALYLTKQLVIGCIQGFIAAMFAIGLATTVVAILTH